MGYSEEERIKGGRKGNRVLRILIISLVLIVAAYAFLQFTITDRETMSSADQQQVEETVEDATAPAASDTGS
jgi:flagellar basal body-associated protein FliL